LVWLWKNFRHRCSPSGTCHYRIAVNNLTLTICPPDRDDAGMIDLCNYCHLHGAEKNGYCSDSCRRSMELFRSAQAVIEMFSSEHAPPSVRRLTAAINALR
jgi:hypothetical protein